MGLFSYSLFICHLSLFIGPWLPYRAFCAKLVTSHSGHGISLSAATCSASPYLLPGEEKYHEVVAQTG